MTVAPLGSMAAAPTEVVMSFAVSREFSLRCHLSRAVALILLAGCEPGVEWDADGVEPRSNDYFVLGKDLGPIPGGGACEECITDAVINNIGGNTWKLDLCIDARVSYVGTSLRLADDVPLRALIAPLTSVVDGTWRLVSVASSAEVTLCNSPDSGACFFDNWEAGESSVALSVEFTTSRADHIPELLRFVPSDATLGAGPHSPAMKIRAPISGGTLQCGDGPAVRMSPGGPVTEFSGNEAPSVALAHMTSRSPYGGIRSCSGVLIASNYVLSASHCFPALRSKGAETHVALLDTSGSLHQAGHVAQEVVHHPEPTRDLALIRLDKPADPTMFQPLAVAPLQPFADDCTLQGQGFGRSHVNIGFDWGKVKTIPLSLVSPEEPVNNHFHPDDLQKIVLFDRAYPGSPELCRGDSGGPIVQDCGGQRMAVGVASARVFESETIALPEESGIERLTSAFAFSYGNTCGEGELIAYVAGRIDDEALQWIHGVIGPNDLPVYF